MRKTTTLIYGAFISGTLFFLILGGCSPQETAEIDPYPDMPIALRSLQGHWEASDTNQFEECDAIVEGYTIRMRYKADSESPLFERNVSIQRIDNQQHLLLVNGGTEAWPYLYDRDNGKEYFKLDFFSKTRWNNLLMKRAVIQRVTVR